MPPIPQPESKLVYSTERPLPRPRDTMLVFASPLATHLANLGHLVEEVVLKNGHVCWRVPAAAEADLKRYEETLRRLNEARRLTVCKLQGGVYDGPREQRG